MSLVFESGESHPMVDALLRVRIGAWTSLPRAIDARDEMYRHSLEAVGGDRDLALLTYFQVGLEQLQLARSIAFWRGANPKRMLEFASGYGRLTRFLVHERFAEEITVSDILPEAMEFASQQFGVSTVVSVSEPEKFAARGEFDFIFVASLFTHLPARTFGAWLERLSRLLSPAGLLAFSVHDQSIAPGRVDGLRFEPSSESRLLDPAEYGSTWVTEDFVRREVSRIGLSACVRLASALTEWQDLYVVSRSPIEPASMPSRPRGFLERCERSGTTIVVSGWATDDGRAPDRVEFRIEDEVVGVTRTFEARPDLRDHLGAAATEAGWHCEIPVSAIRSLRYDTFTISLFGRSGAERILYIGPVEGAASWVASLLRARLDNVTRSNFWRARNQWFRLKRALGLTKEI